MKNGIRMMSSYVAAALGVSVITLIAAPEASAVHQRCVAWTCASTPDDSVHVDFVDVAVDTCDSAPQAGDRYQLRLSGPGLDFTTDATEPATNEGSCESFRIRLDLEPDRTFADGDRICVEGIRLRQGARSSMGEPCLPLTGAGKPTPKPSASPTFPPLR
ncbi:hypothetical protein [Nocardia colli]|uniref:hypothetical protein n=1 Tax=Nocardia colli TaxID=2545717 RepID=UPI0035DC5DB0